MKRVLVLVLAGLACGKTQAPVSDAAVERPATEIAPRMSDVAPTLAVDFAVEGCPSFDAENLACTGTAPLTLRFVPLFTTTVSQYLWDFGDGFDPGQTPSHIYRLPGTYTVKLVVRGLDGVVVEKPHAAFVTVTPNSIGDPCDLDGQCGDKLTCLCPSNSSCEFGPPHGICAGTCESGICDDGQVCAGLATAPPPSGTHEAWQAKLCLPRCSEDKDCSAQLHCRLLPPGLASSASSPWVYACFGDLPADVGQACMDETGALRADLCASGVCTNLGAKGMCTKACSTEACPPESDCALLGDGRSLCLRPCTGGFTCSDDPLLGCVAPGAGDLGYSLVNPGPASASRFCAPKPCSSDQQCLPSGMCDFPNSDGHCVARTD